MATILVTGANRGLGLEFTRQYAADGATVIATCRDPMEANDLATVAGDVRILRLDVTDFERVEAFAKDLAGQPIDVLLNNAGIMGNTSGWDGDDWARTMRTNAFAPFRLSQLLTPNLASSAGKTAAAISSRLGSIAEAGGGYTAYGMSKAALNFAMKSYAAQVSGQGIKVVIFHPGWAQTRMGGSGAPLPAADSVAGMRRVLASLGPGDSGKFLQYDGAEVPW